MNHTFITDLDHTFLRSDLTISAFSRKIWNRKANSSALSIATARSYKKSVQFLDGLTINAPIILLDGALIVNEKKQIIESKTLNKSIGDAIIEQGAKFGIFPFILSLLDEKINEAFIYPSIRNDYQEKLIERYRSDDNIVEQKKSSAAQRNMKIVYMGQESELKGLYEHLRQHFGNSLQYIFAPEAYLGGYFLTLLHPQADKSHGIKTVSEYLKHDLNKITVFGDNLNDLGMFKLAGTSVAVKNAQKAVKEAADIVLPHTNDEDGVANYLRSIK